MNRIRPVIITMLAALGCLLAAPLHADDWPQWRGPQRDGVWRETGLVESLPAAGPKVLWRAPVSGGYSGPAVAGERVFVSDYVKSQGDAVNDPGARPELTGKERILCLDAASGKLLWKHEYDCAYKISYPAGPRATPTVDGEFVYTLGAEGNLVCLAADSGKVAWQLDLNDAFQAPTPNWGFCSHPLIDGDKLIMMAGGKNAAVVALDKRTGKEIWRALDASDAGYSSPTILTAGGRRQLAVWHPQAVSGLDPETGELFWTTPLAPDYGMSINSPCPVGEYLFIGGINNKGLLLKLLADKPGVEIVWRSTLQVGLGPVHSPPIPVGNILYGVDRNGELTALDIPSGKKLWQTYQATTGTRRANSGTAFLVQSGERFFIMSETGELILAKLTPEKYEELGRAKIIEPTHEAFGRNVVWSHPAFAHKSMFVRNDRELVCVSLAAE